MLNKGGGSLNIYAYAGEFLGVLSKQQSGALEFSYSDEWLRKSGHVLSQSMPLTTQVYKGQVVSNYFENLLPDNGEVKEQLAARLGAVASDAFSLLQKLGRDCVGSLTLLPNGEDPYHAWKAIYVEANSVSDRQIAKILLDLKIAPLGIGNNDEFRISIAGAQEKTGLLYSHNNWYRPVGTTATTHILKTQLGKLPNGVDLSNSVENEHFCMRFCESLGLDVADTWIDDFEGVRALTVKRFDRTWISSEQKLLIRLPQEDMCQALSYPPNLKYEADGGPSIKQIADLLRGANDPSKDRLTLIKAQFAFWLLRATDGHAKNFSISLTPNGGFELAPLYDILSAEPALKNGQIRQNRTKMAMSIGKNKHWQFEKITKRHFLETAKICGVDVEAVALELGQMAERCEDALQMASKTVEQGVDPVLAAQISDGARKRAAEYRTM